MRIESPPVRNSKVDSFYLLAIPKADKYLDLSYPFTTPKTLSH